MFANLSVIIVGYLQQLPPIKQSAMFYPFHNDFLNICHLWSWFECCELTKCMRQQGDNKLINLLNSIRLCELSEDYINLLNIGLVDRYKIPENAVNIFCRNAFQDVVNIEKRSSIDLPEVILHASETLPPKVQEAKLEEALNCPSCQAGGLSRVLNLKRTARIMITSNIDLDDRLINGQMGTVF